MPRAGVPSHTSEGDARGRCRIDLLAKECLVAKPTFVLSRSGVCQDVTLQMLRAAETLVAKLAWQRLVPSRAFSHLVRNDFASGMCTRENSECEG